MTDEPTVDSLLRAVAHAPEDPTAAIAPGSEVGRFIVERLLGSGAHGRVYAARDPKLDRMVALKVPRRAGALVREARAAAQIEHPGIARIYEVEPGYIAMELVDGESLRARLRRGRPADALAIAVAICDAVAAAHRRGVVHRDLKPENVLLAPDGSIRVVDFGLAAQGDDVDAPRGGTPGYAAPEAEATPRSDVYALGVIVRELGIARPDVIARATATDPARRYPDASALAAALRARRRWPLVVVLTVVASAAAFGARRSPAAPVPSTTVVSVALTSSIVAAPPAGSAPLPAVVAAPRASARVHRAALPIAPAPPAPSPASAPPAAVSAMVPAPNPLEDQK